jgi:urease subunit beta
VAEGVVPGELLPSDGDVTINGGRETAAVSVANTGDRPVQVGSHFHFFEVNAALAFDRDAAYGMRLDIPAGTAIRFEPGDEQTVDLVAVGGERIVSGMNDLVDGPLDDPERRELALARAREGAYGGAGDGA